MALLQSIAFQKSLQRFLAHLLAVYYTEYRSVCIVRTPSEDIHQVGELPLLLPQFNLVLESVDSDGMDDGMHQSRLLLQQAIDVASCGGFVVTGDALFPLLERFYDAHTGAIVQPDDKRLIGVIANLDEAKVREAFLANDILESLVNVLLVVPNEPAGTARVHTTHLRKAFPIGTTIELVQIGDELVLIGNDTTKPFPAIPEWDYFPDKLSNMEGRRVRVATLYYPPCTTWAEVPLGEGNAMDMDDTSHALQVDGFELILTLEFCRRHNCTLEFVLGTDWGNVLKNGTTTGLIGDMAQQRADLVLAAIYEWHSWWQLLSITTPIGISSVTCLVPRPHLLPFWQTPFLSFPPSLWLMVGVAFVVGILATFVTDLCRHRLTRNGATGESPSNHLLLDAFFFMFSLYVEQSARLRNDLVTAVILLATLLFGGFMIGNSYAGSLASIMTLPRYEKSIDTAADFVARNMRWTGGSFAWMTSLNDATDPAVVRMRDSFEVHDDETRAQMPFTDDRMGFIFERFQHGNFGFGTRIDLNASRRLQSLTEVLFREYTGGYCSRVWPLRSAYDRFILELHQSGIFHYLELTSVIRLFGLVMQRNIANARVHEADGEPIKLSMDHFLGVFFILFFGLGLATVAFVAENIAKKWQRH
ncbi:AGAP012951-PA-like protein [Anopheles sinensis]|uniref:AGAP012951-PA-like protein n=1 Tax=Anopheles sinensis TaxID=74873 RepID=A0A084VA41_ANOSI|nr:AGAP012951-PA-like protein [Anopheles sinensis]